MAVRIGEAFCARRSLGCVSCEDARHWQRRFDPTSFEVIWQKSDAKVGMARGHAGQDHQPPETGGRYSRLSLSGSFSAR